MTGGPVEVAMALMHRRAQRENACRCRRTWRMRCHTTETSLHLIGPSTNASSKGSCLITATCTRITTTGRPPLAAPAFTHPVPRGTNTNHHVRGTQEASDAQIAWRTLGVEMLARRVGRSPEFRAGCEDCHACRPRRHERLCLLAIHVCKGERQVLEGHPVGIRTSDMPPYNIGL